MTNGPHGPHGLHGPHGPCIDVQDVSLHRGGRAILQCVRVSIGYGELVAMVGLNGAGKTSLLSLVATLVAPSGGQIFVDGFDALAQPARVRERIGVVFQESALEARLTARENLWFIAHCQGLAGRAARARVDELLDALGLGAQAATLVRRLSGGERRRLELARALVAKPRVLLLDEPTLGLDVAARDAFWTEIKRLVAGGRTVLCSTHHTDEACDADRVVVLDRGELVALGSWRAMRAPVPGVIRLRVPDIDAARRWLAEHGYPAEVDAQGISVAGADPQAVLPALLRQMPCRVLGADIAAPGLKDVVGHWIAARRGGCAAPPLVGKPA
ncbi:ABC transporter ATP-binding protein [Burkholderia thailandensis]|uniref:ABC transporter ATP-binding protein n=1 Tax=Burkholderia thailandensis TaxID=57975 RepID=UPI0005F24850|nr:ABC transporter ATP-binding protein [Burkholderia thailandensis]AOJ58362.1 ABC transporter ATP-binding protein [Burkholderia thailandensis]KXF63222.1 ABC transporter ATP-binding protein [Burkholderia thailandensis]PNE76524.1 ABC transporter ATP-binding protein [Burkholderia thailandensis]